MLPTAQTQKIRRVRRAFLVVTAVAAILHLILPATASGIVMSVCFLLAAPLGFWAIRIYRPRPSRPWWLLGASIAVFATAPVFAISLAPPGATPSMVASRVGLSVLLGYVPMLLALADFARARTPKLDWERLIDILVIVLSVALPVGTILGAQVLRSTQEMSADRIVALTGPALDIVVLVAILHLLALPGRRPRSLWWILAGLGFASFSNIAQSVAITQHSQGLPAWASLGWLFAGAADTMAALNASMLEVARPTPEGDRKFGVGQASALAIALLSIPATAIADFALHRHASKVLIGLMVVSTISIAGLLLRRVWRLFRAQEATSELALRERYLRGIVGNLSDIILVSNGHGAVVYVSAAIRNVLGYDAERLQGASGGDWVHPEDRATLAELTDHVRKAPGASGTVEFRAQHANGSWVWLELTLTNLIADPNVRGTLALAHDITERREFQRQLEHRALHDQLTGLPNRALLADRLASALARAERRKQTVELLFVDLDDFKAVNDTLGHAAGDVLLTTVAERLRGALRLEDTVARLGGDEFAVIAEDHLSPGFISGRIREALQAPVEIEGRHLTVTASIGVARSDGVSTVDMLLRNADLAMYEAKAAGKNQAREFTPKMYEDASAREDLLSYLRDALERSEMRLYYQPVVSVRTDQPVSVEALLRWQHPTLGLLGPDKFIPLAEQSGLIVPIGRWVLQEACRQIQAWDAAAGGPRLSVAVNLSLRQLDSDGIVNDVAAALKTSGVHPSRLTLEVTETMLMHDVAGAAARLQALKSLGVRLAVDDFGTGYSSLAYLQELPIDVLKIDRTFVTQVATNPEARVLFHSMVQMAEALRVATVAEGVEDSDQLDVLRDEGCDLAQGFLIARPLPPEDLVLLLTETETERTLSEGPAYTR